jgi:H+/Cl- antiporter ClcA
LSFFQATDIIHFRGVYSLLGAAAFCGSVTRTVSVSMIVLELNGHLSHACPIMVCVLTSYTVSEYIKPQSFFEMLSEFAGLDAKIAANGKIIVKDIL